MTNEEAIKRVTIIKIYGGMTIPVAMRDIEAIDMAIKALEEQERPTGDRKCVTCKYCDGEIINKHCRTCSHAWADLYEEAENEARN